MREVHQVPQIRRNRAAQDILVEIQMREVHQVPQLGWEGTAQLVTPEGQLSDLAVIIRCDPVPVTQLHVVVQPVIIARPVRPAGRSIECCQRIALDIGRRGRLRPRVLWRGNPQHGGQHDECRPRAPSPGRAGWVGSTAWKNRRPPGDSGLILHSYSLLLYRSPIRGADWAMGRDFT